MRLSNPGWLAALGALLLVSCSSDGPDISLPNNTGGTVADTSPNTPAQDDTLAGEFTGDTVTVNEPMDLVVTPVDTPVDPTPTNQNAHFSFGDADVLIPRVRDNPPQIDGQRIDMNLETNGLTGEWENAVQRTPANDLLLINNLMEGTNPNPSTSFQHRWAALHDDNYLYILVISDDEGDYHFDTQEARKPWKDDDLELYFDGNNSLLNNYDGVDDFHMHINLIDPVTSQGNTSYGDSRKLSQAVNSATLPSDLLFAVGLQRGPLFSDRVFRADIYEIRIKLSELNITVGQPFGFEVQINDDDDGDTRDTKWGWHHPAGSDQAWESPSFLATAVLQ